MPPLQIRPSIKVVWQLFASRFVYCLPWAIGLTFAGALYSRYFQVLQWWWHSTSVGFPFTEAVISLVAYLLIVCFSAGIYFTITQTPNIGQLLRQRYPMILLAFVLYSISIAIGIYCYVVPGVVLLFFLSLYYPLVINQHQHPIRAYGQSFYLLAKYLPRSLGFFSVILLLLMPLILAATLIAYFWLVHEGASSFVSLPAGATQADLQHQARMAQLALVSLAFHHAMQVLLLFIAPFIAAAKITWLEQVEKYHEK